MQDKEFDIEDKVLEQFDKDEKLNLYHFIDWCCANRLDCTMKNLDKYIDEVK